MKFSISRILVVGMGAGLLVLATGCSSLGLGGAEARNDKNRFIKAVTLPQGGMVVVAEGDCEPRSLGSYSVRLYGAESPEFPFDDYRDGLVRERENGFIENVLAKDLDGDGRSEIAVLIRCVGSGRYRSADAYRVSGKKLQRMASLRDIRPNVDVLELLAFKVNPAEVGTPAWYEAVEKAVGIKDEKGHGPSPGSSEWMTAVDARLFPDKGAGKDSLGVGSRKWLEVVHMVVFR
ncbi:MAG: PliI family lysozyme inhibitor of I-type lysozyme [bacterium]